MMQKGAASVSSASGVTCRIATCGVVLTALLGAGVAATTTSGCGDYGPVTLASFDGGDIADLRARGVGEACDDASRCRPGLACNAGHCAPGHSLDQGATCVISAECKEGLYCGATRKCVVAGRLAAGEACGSEADCAGGARCNPIGLSAECQAAGTLDIGVACKTSADCFAGLLCTAGACAAPPSSSGSPAVAVSSFAGVACQDDPGPVRSYFRVPRGPDDGDFFRLPFPNDVRRKAGKVDLRGFPTPGADVLGYDLVDRWARYVEESADGFSAYPTIVMRFAGSPDFSTLKQTGVVRMVDVTTATGSDIGFGWNATTAKSKYVCGNSITARPTPGEPLLPGHVYATFVTNGVKAPGGVAIEVAPDLKALLGAADPGAPLSEAWASYAPLRTWAAKAKLDLATLVQATVFTVGKHTDLVGKIATAVAAAPPPAVTGWVKCGTAPSPCPQAEGARACGAVDPAFDELHALVTLPTWQKGTAPYRTPDEGGDVALDGSGAPVAQGSAQVCLSLTVPKGAPMPATGWPLAIYAHATGGSFRSHVTDGVAARFASADAGAAHVAVLGIDQVAHGTRRGGSTARPEALWFVTSNPRAMRGNTLQAASDVLALARLAPTFKLLAAASPTGADIRFGEVMLVGHGQGATAVTLAAPRTAAKGVVVGGVGASFLDTVVSKRSPVDFASVAPTILGEVTLTAAHPVLAMFQNALDPVDPLDHASLLVTAPVTQAKHSFVVYGRGDSFTPGPTQSAYTAAAGLGVAAPPNGVGAGDDIGAPILPIPAGGNAASSITAIVRQYDRGSDDGHFVMLRSPDATRDVERFVADVALAKTPKVGR
jgi:hypothetical protein